MTDNTQPDKPVPEEMTYEQMCQWSCEDQEEWSKTHSFEDWLFVMERIIQKRVDDGEDTTYFPARSPRAIDGILKQRFYDLGYGYVETCYMDLHSNIRQISVYTPEKNRFMMRRILKGCAEAGITVEIR